MDNMTQGTYFKCHVFFFFFAQIFIRLNDFMFNEIIYFSSEKQTRFKRRKLSLTVFNVS